MRVSQLTSPVSIEFKDVAGCATEGIRLFVFPSDIIAPKTGYQRFLYFLLSSDGDSVPYSGGFS